MNKRLDALSNEVGCECSNFKIDTKNIKNKVNTTLNSDFEEKRIYMKQKLIKIIAIAAAIVALGATTVFAAVNSDLLKEFFAGDASAVQNHVKTPRESVTDGRFTLTLEQVLASKYQVLVVFSIEGLTTEAVSELMRDGKEDLMSNTDSISFGPKDKKAIEQSKFNGYTWGEIEEKRTSTKRYWTLSSSYSLNENEEDYYIKLGVMNPSKEITVPMKCNVETLDLVLKNPSYGDTEIKMTPIGVVLETTSNETEFFTNVFFRMKNGEIKTFNELLKDNMDYGNEPAQEKMKGGALFHSIMNFSDFKSVIVDKIEYDIKDTSKTKTVEIDKKLYPFKIKPVNKDKCYMPVNEFCEKIGAAMEWDDKTEALTITYRDLKYVITNGSNVVLRNGKKVSLYNDEEIFFSDGKLVASIDFIGEAMHMDIGFPFELRKVPEEDWTWTVIP